MHAVAAIAPGAQPSRAASVRVAHSMPLVALGLVSTLRRLPGWDVVDDDEADVVVGDLPHLQRWCGSAAHARKLVLVSNPQQAPLTVAPPGIAGRVTVQCAETELFETIRRLCGDGPNAAQRGTAVVRGGMAPGALRRVREHVLSQLSEPIEMQALAAIAGLSVCHFSRAFRQSMGLPPHRWVMQQRMAQACALIRDGNQPLSDIGLAVGFSDQSHFTRTFVRFVGETPRDYRHRHR